MQIDSRRLATPARGAGLAICLMCLTSWVSAQASDSAPDPADVDAGKAQPLELKPGCWQIRLNTHGSLTAAALTGGDPERVRGNKQAEALLKQGVSGTDTKMACTDAPFIQYGVEVYGTKLQACERSLRDSGGIRYMHVLCPGSDGQAPLLAADYERSSAESFKGTRSSGQNGSLVSLVFAGKWISESKPHDPASPRPTDLDGKTPRGATAIALFDGFRYVTEIDGKRLTALESWKVLYAIRPAVAAKIYGPKVADQLQEIYMHWFVADEAIAQGLALVAPWRGQLAAVGMQDMTPAQARLNQWSSGSPYTPNAMDEQERRSNEEVREKVLWEAYFSRAKDAAEKQSMLHELQQKYALQILDPDFFTGP